MARSPPGQRRDSFVLFTVPAFQMFWSPWDDLEKHKRRYTLAGARALAEAAGFEIVRATYFFFPLFFAAAAVKGLRGVRAGLAGKPPAARYDELTEARNNAALNRTMLGSCWALEQRWLQHHDLPLGTSVLVLARPRHRGRAGTWLKAVVIHRFAAARFRGVAVRRWNAAPCRTFMRLFDVARQNGTSRGPSRAASLMLGGMS